MYKVQAMDLRCRANPVPGPLPLLLQLTLQGQADHQSATKQTKRKDTLLVPGKNPCQKKENKNVNATPRATRVKRGNHGITGLALSWSKRLEAPFSPLALQGFPHLSSGSAACLR
jgi:hypothetical protein